MSRQTLHGKKVLVTGAGGFIGSHLTQALVEAGAEVTAMLRYGSTASIGYLAELPAEVRGEVGMLFGDIGDAEFVRSAVAGKDMVLHLAALIGIPYSYVAPRSYLRTNTEGTLNLLEAARQCELPLLVHTSTSEVYGSARYVPMDEGHPLQGQSPYSASKIAADKLVEAYHRSFELPVVTLRPFNTYGPRQSARAVIPATILQALWSPTIRLGAMTPIRDMNYVEDTVAGFLAAAVNPGLIGGTYNLGSGEGVTIGEIVSRILQLSGRTDQIETDPERLRPEASEVDRLVSNNAAFRAATGWSPRFSLDQGLQRTIEWFRGQGRPDAPEVYVR